MKFLSLLIFCFSFLVEVNAQPKTLYGLKTLKLIQNHASDESFYMDETPVTYEDFKKYVRAGGEKTAYWYYETYNINEQPVTGINWFHAIDYCNWRSICEGLQPVYQKADSLDSYGYPIYVNDTTANGYRLPTPREFASIFDEGIKYPWGNSFFENDSLNDQRCNIDIDSGMLSTKWWRLAPVKSQYKSKYGLYNVTGNIWHWTESWSTISGVDAKILMGSGWGTIDTADCYIGNSSWCMPGNYNYDIGFRCVKNLNGVADSMIRFDTTVKYSFYTHVTSKIDKVVTDFYGQDFKEDLAEFISDNYPRCINFLMKVDQQETIIPYQMAELIISVCKRNNINPLFLTTIMISESGFGTVSFPRWYNNPMAYMWQNKLMVNGEPVYESLPGKKNRKYKTLEDGFEAFCKGIRRDLYYKAAKKDLDSFHLIYVGYRADEWMNTMTRIYRDIAGVRFEPKFPIGDAGKYIYTDWETIKKNVK